MAELTEAPIPASKAFEDANPDYAESQAATILLFGNLISAMQETERTRLAGTTLGQEALVMTEGEAEDLRTLEVPLVLPEEPEILYSGRRDAEFLKSNDLDPEYAIDPEPGGRMHDRYMNLVKKPTAMNTLALFEQGMRHTDPLVRVSSAVAMSRWDPGSDTIIQVLVGEFFTTDQTVAEIARVGLAQVAPDRAEFLEVTSNEPAPSNGEPSHTSLLVHGTFARNQKWWQPGTDTFHDYLSGHRGDLYKNDDRFDWSGGYSDQARALGAIDLLRWLDEKQIDPVSLFTHSHGGNLAMMASAGPIHVEQLVMLSCPVHVRKYVPDFGHVDEVVSIRMHMDLVILADRGGQRFRDTRIRELVLPVWFKHSATHDDNVWERYSVANFLTP